MTSLLGGPAYPAGCTVQFVAAPRDVVLEDLLRWRSGLGQRTRVVDGPEGELDEVLPGRSPWRRELLVAGGRWTAYLNDGLRGGDPTASAVVVARRLGVPHVVAQHLPSYGPGHAATQLWVSGPDGAPPLMLQRTLSATATDGRWAWHASGAPLPFEDLDRYRARRIQDRFDRPLLLRYLADLGITPPAGVSPADAVLVEQIS
ncbi:hypothetical protein [Klenkia terrae]|uniref:Uncharacterized protein n=2 Tax=Klenkia terrae TaxID=1052259 RepID=A0ABU8E7G9_9ACTN|nr:hypothetical protein [Klenkia terrae]SSC25925.1 Hypothetical protein KLENKIAIHU_4551 [Klenkia terrae]